MQVKCIDDVSYDVKMNKVAFVPFTGQPAEEFTFRVTRFTSDTLNCIMKS